MEIIGVVAVLVIGGIFIAWRLGVVGKKVDEVIDRVTNKGSEQ